MLTLNALPFSTGRATYRDFDPENPSRKRGFDVRVVLPDNSGGSLYALVCHRSWDGHFLLWPVRTIVGISRRPVNTPRRAQRNAQKPVQ